MPSQYTRKHRRDRALFAEWDAATRHGGHRLFASLPVDRLKAAQAGLQGHIVLPGDADYNHDRQLFNPIFDAHPIAIVYCVVESDVAIALSLGRLVEQLLCLPFTVRSGGHCSAGFSAGAGVLIDVSGLTDCTVDPVTQVATVGCGCPFSKFDNTLAAYGLHVPGGECSDVCIGGYVQGGGYGFTSVTFGMNCDNVIDLRVMLADGRIVNASPSVNPDLFWAMRGGTGGNFGVLLQVRYQLRPLGDCFGWALIWPLANESDLQNATGALMALQSGYMLGQLPAALNIQVSLAYQPGIVGNLPPTTPLAPYLLVRGLFVGSQAEGQAAIAPLLQLPGGTLQWTEMASFQQLNSDLLNVPYSMPWFPPDSPMPYEDKASRYMTRPWSTSEWRSLLDYFVTSPNAYSYFYMEFYGGAINAYPADGPNSNAFVHRNAAFNAVLDVLWFDPADQPACETFLRGWMTLMAPMWNGEIYQNYPRLDEPDYGARYWVDAQAGLYAVKCKYDPDGAFTFAQQVGPLMGPGGGPGPVIVMPGWLQQWLDQPIVVAVER
jgi:FAD binding domain/Berberine and berberine like